MFQVEGFVDSAAMEGRLAHLVARGQAREQAQAGSALTQARVEAQEAARAYREALAPVLARRNRGRKPTRRQVIAHDEALAAMEAANERVEGLLGVRWAA